MAYQIITDGSCDLGREIPEKTGIKVVPFYVTFDGQNYQKEIEELGVREFSIFVGYFCSLGIRVIMTS